MSTVVYKDIFNMKGKDLAEMVMQDLSLSAENRADALQANRRYRRMYKVQDEPGLQPQGGTGDLEEDLYQFSNTYLPVSTMVVNIATQNIYNNLFGDSQYFEIEPQEEEDEIRAEISGALIRRRHRQMKFKRSMINMIKQGLKYDYAIALTSWLTEPGTVIRPVMKKETHEFKTGLKEEFETIQQAETFVPNKIDRSHTTILNNFHCFHDWAATEGLADSSFFCDVREVSFRELINNQRTKDNPEGLYINLDKIDNGSLMINAGIELDTKDVLRRTAGLQRTQNGSLTVIRYFTPNGMVQLSGDGTVITDPKPMAGFPLVDWRLWLLENTFEGMGLLQSMERMQYDMNAIINNKRDFQQLVLNPISVIDQSLASAIDGSTELIPGQQFVTAGPTGDKITFYKPGLDVGSSSSEELSLEFDMVSKVSQLGQNAQGSFAKGRRSAREAAGVQGATDLAMGFASIIFETEVIEPVIEQQLFWEMKNLKGEHRFRDLGPNGKMFVEVNENTLLFGSTPTIKALGISNIQKNAVETSNLIQAMQITGNLGLMNQINIPEVLKELWRRQRPEDYQKFLKQPGMIDQINIPPEEENVLFGLGRHPDVKPTNDHIRHIQSHEEHKLTPDYALWPDALRQEFEIHINRHKAAMQQDQAQRQGQSQAASGPVGLPGRDGRPVQSEAAQAGAAL